MPCIRGPDRTSCMRVTSLFHHLYRHRPMKRVAKKGTTMTCTSTRQAILTLTMALTSAVPLSVAQGTAHASAATQAGVAAARPAARTFTGSVEQMQQWGPIQVSIVVMNKKITQALATLTAHSGRSAFIQANAVPILKRETLMAQSARIDAVSGATDMSTAYDVSLANAIARARAAKALR